MRPAQHPKVASISAGLSIAEPYGKSLVEEHLRTPISSVLDFLMRCRLIITNRGTLASDHFLFAKN